MVIKNVSYTLIALAFGITLNSCSEFQQEKPNLVFIFIDDLGWKDLGYMGSEFYETPHIDGLANKGMIFTNAYANAANCAPTRASLLSGQYSPRHGVYTVARPDRGDAKDRRLIPIENSRKISLDKITIAEALKPAGYVSAAFGKWNVGNSPLVQGFDVALDRYDLEGYNGGHFGENGEYLTDRLTSEAVEFIKMYQDQPFFLYLSHHAVHTPIQGQERLVSKYENKDADGCHQHSAYAAMVEGVDRSVGEISSILENLGLSENTILIFFSDNGGHGTYTCQKPLRGGKGMFYEGGIRVPMFAYWPQHIESGSQNDEPVIGFDFYPTFLDLAGVEQPENYPLDGESILPLLKGNKALDRDELYWHFPAYLQSYEGMRSESRDTLFRSRPVSVIRDGDWKLLMYHEEWVLDGGREKLRTNNAVELYNLDNDLGENNNLANIETSKREELLDKLLQWQEKINAPIPTVPNPEYQEK